MFMYGGARVTETELTGGIDCDSMQEVMAGSPPPDFGRCEFPRLY